MQAKGRNGYFKVAGLDARHSVDGSSVSLELFSRRAGDSAPLIIRGTPAEMKRLAGQLLLAIHAAEDVPPCHCAPGRVLGAGHAPGCSHATTQNVTRCKQCGTPRLNTDSEYCGGYCEQLAAEGLPSARL